MEDSPEKVKISKYFKTKVVGLLIVSGFVPDCDFDALASISDAVRFIDNENIIESVKQSYFGNRAYVNIEIPSCFTDQQHFNKIELAKPVEVNKIELPHSILPKPDRSYQDIIIKMFTQLTLPSRFRLIQTLMPVITVTISSFIERYTVIPKEVVDETAIEAIKTSKKTVVLPALAALADFFKRI